MTLSEQLEEADTHWIIDSGCTSHMCKNERIFYDLNKETKLNITLGDGKTLRAKGKGSIALTTNQGKRVIPDVLHVFGMRQNLLIVSQIIRRGYTVVFKENSCSIKDSRGYKIANILMINKSFILKL